MRKFTIPLFSNISHELLDNHYFDFLRYSPFYTIIGHPSNTPQPINGTLSTLSEPMDSSENTLHSKDLFLQRSNYS